MKRKEIIKNSIYVTEIFEFHATFLGLPSPLPKQISFSEKPKGDKIFIKWNEIIIMQNGA